MSKKIVLITGASSGIGQAIARYLSSKNYTVYGTSRKAPFPPMQKTSDSFFLIQMDVNDTTSVTKAITYILEKEKRIDVVINNAGWGISGAIEETTIEKTKQLFETNYFGTQRVIQTVLPTMRSQKQGTIINISSIGGVLGLPFQGLYSATKFAVEGMTEALRMELNPFNIHVALVEPGDFKTGFTKQRESATNQHKNSAYQHHCKQTTAVFEDDEQKGSSPEIIAPLIEKIITSSKPKLRYRVGSFSQKLAAKMKGVFPDRFVQWILMKYYQLI